ncbi:polysaccharide biosynthesis tyrosine autokinase [Paraburkholderia sabiae]|uniref:Polysaccharide biosynthesis tyrosine autokinase n=1 Tax=Paraburkholderia sabiae TaxID=273251 RepID=A0ABU9QBW8_9BURK|nr:polysaccharide biosynthesis tyrosine autokinase [Paraburkholderia sabiae]WJZ77046.1 polysaccharide biosynthesis tyrosine autokinase [Paraburkholderia sabiae]
MNTDVERSGSSNSRVRPDPDEEVVLGDLVHVIAEDIWWLVGFIIVALTLAGIYCLLAKPVYLADALIKIEQGDDSTQELTQLSSVASVMAPIPSDAEIAIIQSRDVMAPVVSKFKLNFRIEPNRVPILGSIACFLATPGELSPAWFGLPSFAWGGEIVDVESIQVPLELEAKKLILTAESAGQYQLTGPDGELLIRGHVDQPASGHGVTILIHRLIARPGTRFFITRINDVDAINEFRKSVQVQEQGKLTGLVDVSMESEDPTFASDVANDLAHSYLRHHVESKQANAQNMLSFLKSEEPRLRAELDKAEIALAQYQRRSGSITAGEEAKIYLAGSIEYEQQLSAVRLQVAALEQRFGDDHPLLKAAHEQMAELQAQRDRFDLRFRALPETEIQAVKLQRDAKVAAAIYELVLTREQELSMQKAGIGGSAQIVDLALRAGTPIRPKKTLILSAGIVLGMILGVSMILARRRLFKGIEDAEEIERAFNLPICGIVPLSDHHAKIDAKGSESDRRQAVLADANPTDICVESLRSLRTSLQFTMMDARNRIVVLTGPVAAVGKSFLAVNLAVLIANSGKKVLLIDADMRRGALERYIGGSAINGLAELLAGQIRVVDAVRETSFQNLYFISCGKRPSNPAELLASRRFSTILSEYESKYDVILIDTPPILAVTDAALVAEHAGSTFLVLRAGMHRQREIADAIKRLKIGGINLNGGILNGVSSFRRYGYGSVHQYLSTSI